MNKNWRNRPTTIDYISKSVDYIIGIDESGNSDLHQVLKAKETGAAINVSDRHFTVTACLISMDNFVKARDMVMTVKNDFWNNALYQYNGIEKRVCFHSKEIRGRKGAFSPDRIDYPKFIGDLSRMMESIPLTLYASHIDKLCHVKQYAYPLPTYDLCMTFVIERVMRDIGNDKTCIIVLEARGKKEDRELLNHIKSLIDNGSRYYPSSHFRRIKGVYFNPKWCKIANDKMSYWALELADLCAYPIQKYFLYNNRDRAFEVLLPKISCYPDVVGKGLKSFP